MSNPEWALTDDEIWGIYKNRINGVMSGMDLGEGNVPSGRAIAHAQAKKLMEWGDGDCPHAGYVLEYALLHKRECWRCWQTLEKGLEDG